MRVVYIRHAHKDYQNGNAEFFKFDPSITDEGVARAKIIAKHLVDLYGEPTRIISSPFRRTRETATVLGSILKNQFADIYEIDRDVGEYLGNHNGAELDVVVATRIHNPFHSESFETMKKRVKKHIEKIRKRNSQNSKEIIWVVTHGIIVKQVVSYFGIKSSKEIPYLTCFSILETEELVRAEFLLFRNMLEEKEGTVSFSSFPPNNSSNTSNNSFASNKRKPNYRYDKPEKNFISPQAEYTGRDDISGRK